MDAIVNYRAGIDYAVALPQVTATYAGQAISSERMDLRIENAVKTFQGTEALRGVSLDIGRGELIALLGPSGSGKTTLLRLIAGLEFPTSGRVLFGGHDACACTVQERNVGFVFQHYALFRHLTVFENIAFGLRVRPRASRPAEAAIRARVLDLLELIQLSGLDRRYPSQLSGGQQQRVALARALAVDPRVLLLDEPFGALDAKVRKELRRWLREIHDQTGHTTLFVTHDQEEALELADRVVVMNDGGIEQVGTADDIHDRPATPFVFGFIGASSSLPVKIDRGRVFFDDRVLSIDGTGQPDGPATLFFRPGHIRLEAGGLKGSGAISAVVCGSRRIGDVRRVELETGVNRHRVEIDVPNDMTIALNQSLAFQIVKVSIFPSPVRSRAVERPADRGTDDVLGI